MSSRTIWCNSSYTSDIRHAQNSENEQKKLPTIFCANQPINYSKKQNNCFRQSFHTCLENVTNTAITNTYHGFKFQDTVCSGCHDSTMLIVLFITFANLKQLIYQKILFLKIIDMYKKYCLNF